MGKDSKNAKTVKDVVCGMEKPISQMKAKSVFLGKTYYFCTEGDKEKFDAFPDYWVPKEEREKYRNKGK